MTNHNFDAFEQEILNSVEYDEWQSKSNIKERLAELQSYLKHEKKSSFNVRPSCADS